MLLDETLRDAVDRWASDRLRAREIDRAHAIPKALLDEAAELGLFGMSIPESHGGAGLGLPEVCEVVAALASHDRSVATTIGLHLGLGTRGLVRYGSAALKDRVLPRLASGRAIAAFAATEPNAGSDLTGLSTRGLARDGALALNGNKIFVTNGGLARFFTLLVATPGLGDARRGASLVLLERGDTGLSIGKEEEKLGLRGSSTTPVDLDDVLVPMERIIGAPGRGMEQVAHVLAWGRTAMAAGCVGSARAALALATAHVAERRQFGRPLARLEVVRDQLGWMRALLFAMEALVRRTAASADDETLASRSTAAKLLCSEGNWEICDTTLQLHGGPGYIEETGVPLLLRDARITRIFEGANDVLLLHLGAQEAVSPRVREPLSPGADAVHRALRERRDELSQRLGLRLVRDHRLLHQLGRLALLREASDAATLRARDEGTAEAHALAEHFVAHAHGRLSPFLSEPLSLDGLGV